MADQAINEDFKLCGVETAFNQKFVRRYFTVKKIYVSPYDILSDIKEGKLDKLFEDYGEHKDLIRVCVEISTEKVDDKAKLLYDTFNAVTRNIERNDEMKDKIINELYKNMLNHEKNGSGWAVVGIKRIRIDHSIKSNKVNRYGDFIPWPMKTAGKNCIVNIRTKYDCVRLSMVAHFCHNEVRKRSNNPIAHLKL